VKNTNTVKPGRLVGLALPSLAVLGAGLDIRLAQLVREQGRRAARQAGVGRG
jgi:hypothetical protein